MSYPHREVLIHCLWVGFGDKTREEFPEQKVGREEGRNVMVVLEVRVKGWVVGDDEANPSDVILSVKHRVIYV